MIVGCYTVDLYCDSSDCRMPYGRQPQYTGETEGECLRQARKDGWHFTRPRPRKAYCPWCNGKPAKGKPAKGKPAKGKPAAPTPEGE